MFRAWIVAMVVGLGACGQGATSGESASSAPEQASAVSAPLDQSAPAITEESKAREEAPGDHTDHPKDWP